MRETVLLEAGRSDHLSYQCLTIHGLEYGPLQHVMEAEKTYVAREMKSRDS